MVGKTRMTAAEKPMASPESTDLRNTVVFGLIFGLGFGIARVHDWYELSGILTFAVATLFAAKMAGGIPTHPRPFGPAAYWMLFGVVFCGCLSVVIDYNNLFEGLYEKNYANTFIVDLIVGTVGGLVAGTVAPVVTSVLGYGDSCVKWVRFGIIFLFSYLLLSSLLMYLASDSLTPTLLQMQNIVTYTIFVNSIRKLVSATIAGGIAGLYARVTRR